MTDGELVALAAKEYILPMGNLDALILGCTHFPLLAATISRILPGTELINTGECLAKEMVETIEKGLGGEDEYFVSDIGRGTAELACRIMGRGVTLEVASAE